MADVYDPIDSDGNRISGFALDRLKRGWSEASDAQPVGGSSRRAGLGDIGYVIGQSARPAKLVPVDHDPFAGSGLPPGYVIDKPARGAAPPFDPSKPYQPVDRNPFDQFDPDKYLEDAPWVKDPVVKFDDLIPPTYGTAESAFEGALKGASANWRDEIYGVSRASGLPEIVGGLRAPIGAARLALEHYTGKPGPATAEYERARDMIRARESAMAKQHPYAFGAGELGGAGASMLAVPGSSAATVPARLWNAAKVGAGYGALAGAGEGEGAEGALTEGATGAVTGAALGTLGTGALELATPVVQRGAAAVRGAFWPEDEALRRVALAAKADAGGKGGELLTPQDVQFAQQHNIPLGVLDTGGNTMRALAEDVATTSPRGRAALEELIKPRFEEQNTRASDFIRHITSGADAAGDLETLQDAARRTNRPAYKAAYAAGENGLWTPELERLAGAPAVRQAMQDAVQRGRDRAVSEGYGAFNPGVTFENGIMQFGRGKGAPSLPTAQFWDYTQRELRDMATAATRGGRNEEAGALNGLRRSLLGELDSANPAFAQARQGAASFFGAENALEAGQKFVRQSADISAARRAVARMSPAEKELFARGYASNLADAVERTGDNRNIVLDKVFKSPAGRQRTQLALGPGRAQQLEAYLRIESLLDRSRQQVLGGSPTMRRAAQLGMAGLATGTGYSILEGDVNPFHVGPVALAGALLHGAGQRINQRVVERVGQLLASDRTQDVARGAKIASRDAAFMARLRQLTAGTITGAGTEAATELSHQKPGQGFKHGGYVGSRSGQGRQYAAGGAASHPDDGAFRADLEAAGLKVSPRARGGRTVARRVPGEKPDVRKATHAEVGYTAKSTRPKQKCSLCKHYVSSANKGPACTRVQSPIAMSGWCKRFARDTSITPAEIRDVVRDAVARGEKREDVLKRLRQMGLPAPAGV